MPYVLFRFMPCLRARWQNKATAVLGKILGPQANLVVMLPPADLGAGFGTEWSTVCQQDGAYIAQTCQSSVQKNTGTARWIKIAGSDVP
jgi:hypothetical protein